MLTERQRTRPVPCLGSRTGYGNDLRGPSKRQMTNPMRQVPDGVRRWIEAWATFAVALPIRHNCGIAGAGEATKPSHISKMVPSTVHSGPRT